MIAFIGTVFSPWYHWSGRKNPYDHVCFNVVTYGPGGRFTMADRGEASLNRSRDHLAVGASRMEWHDDKLSIEVDEPVSLPKFGRLRGTIVVEPSALTGVEVELTPDGRHRWTPFAPVARIAVDLGPGWRWQGHGYFDGNRGSVPLEKDFRHWTWGRFPTRRGATCFYDGIRANGTELSVALEFDDQGHSFVVTPPPVAKLPKTAWRVSRTTRADAGYRPSQASALLDAPFYSRSLVRTRIGGEETAGVHEALDLRRYAWPIIKLMVALRVPRIRR